MLEIQSTYNPNMPFRLLQYITAMPTQLIDDSEGLYRNTLVKLKTPKLYTFFTGLSKWCQKALKVSNGCPMPLK